MSWKECENENKFDNEKYLSMQSEHIREED